MVDVLQLAKSWDAKATAWESQARRINRTACHDGSRNMRVGLATAARMCAAELRSSISASPSDQVTDDV